VGSYWVLGKGLGGHVLVHAPHVCKRAPDEISCERAESHVFGDYGRSYIHCTLHFHALRDLGFSGKGEMKTSSLGRTARPCAAVDRYQAIDFDEPHRTM
jgi:hypothetical protein